MSAADLVPGRLVPYRHLWAHERRAGIVEGRKLRPCVVLFVDTETAPGSRIVGVLPITHTPPDPERRGDAMELPATLKARLALDDERSWILVTEFNRFTWPKFGFDLELLPDGRGSYGSLSPGAFATVRKAVRENRRRRRLAGVDRDG